MKAKTKSLLVTLIIIIIIAMIAFVVLSKRHPSTDAETAQCIGSKSVLYTQLGCHFCETQEEMFGNNYQYLNVVDCWYNHQACIDYNITGTPTWIIKNKKYEGVQTIDKLKEITGC